MAIQDLLTPEKLATLCFGLAILHTFLVKRFQHLARRYPEGSMKENFFHLLGEVEIVFGLWAAIYLAARAVLDGPSSSTEYINSRNFTEPAFVFVIMTLCATRPILSLANQLISGASRLLPIHRSLAFFVVVLIVGPLLGSFITEPAAMTVTALLLLDRFYSKGVSTKLMYATIGVLFVNISIGGTLTPYAAPPVLMVAPKWGWDLPFMMANFGWKGALACIVSTMIVAFRYRKEISGIPWSDAKAAKPPLWVGAVHIAFLVAVVLTAHHIPVFVGFFLFFLGFVSVTREHQDEVKLKEGLLVAFFLAGLVVLGGPQGWWLEPILSSLDAVPLYLSAISLTAITDNAALTYLGSLVPNLSDASKYALVAGSVVGGGLTVIANAPNPAGFGILNPSFGPEGISPLRLFIAALVPTLVAGVCFWFL